MKKIATFISSIFLFSSLIAQTNQPVISKIKATYDIDSKGDTSSYTEYFYDKSGRCIKSIYNDSYFGYVENIEYPTATKVISKKVYTKDNTTRLTTFTLNAQGRAISFVQIEKGDTTTDRIVYAASGFGFELGSAGWMGLSDAELKEMNLDINKALVVVNGNIVKNEREEKFEYFLDKKNTIGQKNFGILYMGNDNKNLMKLKSVPVMDTYVNTKYKYEFDAKGRVIKQTEIMGQAEEGLITLYSYIN